MHDVTSTRPIRTSPHRVQWLGFGLLVLALLAAVFIAAGQYGAADADQAVSQRGQASAALHVSALVAELEKQRAVPFLVARDSDVRNAVLAPSPAALTALNAKLEGLATGVRASVIYVLDAAGLTVASSNYRSATSFVGTNYADREYYRDALSRGTASHFALGSVSQRPGLYLAERIDGPDGTIGIVVLKVEFAAMEAAWLAGNSLAYVMDARGVVLLTDIPDWRFDTRFPVDADEAAALRASLQFAAPLDPLPITPATTSAPIEPVRASLPPASRTADYLRITNPVPATDWTLSLLMPVAAERAASVNAARSIGLLALAPVLIALAFGLWYLQRTSRARDEQSAVRQVLETGIAARTADLTRALAEQQAASTREARLREDLAQSNRLAVLGQIAAGVAHEINQPVGAIRAYAENGMTLLERADTTETRANLSAIARLTERIGTITEQLRGFARKSERRLAPTDLTEATNAALTLLGSNLRSHSVALDFGRPAAPILVRADRLGLEQILVNLIQNALEALENTPAPAVTIAIAREGERVRLTITDNGPGIPPAIFAQLFTPFSTSKPKGLGLGLVISHDLAQSFGGALSAANTPAGGAVFTLELAAA